jgi:hypothetical protein
MTCGTCGATIADKAIVCYRCGAPTAAPASPAASGPSRPAARRPSPVGALVLLVLGIGLLPAGMVLPPEADIQRDPVQLAGLALGVIGAARLVLRRR